MNGRETIDFHCRRRDIFNKSFGNESIRLRPFWTGLFKTRLSAITGLILKDPFS